MSLTWEVAFPIGIVVLGLALAWALLRYRTRNKANDGVTEAATHEEYSNPAGYGRKEAQLRDQLEK